MEFVKRARGGFKLCHDGFTYTKKADFSWSQMCTIDTYVHSTA